MTVRIQPTPAALAAVGLAVAPNEWIVRDLSRPLTGPPYPGCSRCGHHEVKTYHFDLRADGTVMVSDVIWQRLSALDDRGGLEPVNTVTNPPKQRIVLPAGSVTVRPGTF